MPLSVGSEPLPITASSHHCRLARMHTGIVIAATVVMEVMQERRWRLANVAAEGEAFAGGEPHGGTPGGWWFREEPKWSIGPGCVTSSSA